MPGTYYISYFPNLGMEPVFLIKNMSNQTSDNNK